MLLNETIHSIIITKNNNHQMKIDLQPILLHEHYKNYTVMYANNK